MRAAACILALALLTAAAPPEAAPTVGMPARIDQLVLPGPELEAKPAGRDDPLVLRVVETYPHGTAFRYDLVYYGLEPGRYDLREYLRRKDGAAAADLPPIPVEVRAGLPPGQVEPHPLPAGPLPRLGGYRLALAVLASIWVIGLGVLIQAGRRRAAAAAAGAPAPPTLADRLRPLVEGAVAGRLDTARLAELERLLIGYWQRRLGLAELPPAEVIVALRRDPQAGPLLGQLEAWLHRPGATDAVDVPALLAPYRDLPADALEEEAAVS
jgi:hypothetical protein